MSDFSAYVVPPEFAALAEDLSKRVLAAQREAWRLTVAFNEAQIADCLSRWRWAEDGPPTIIYDVQWTVLGLGRADGVILVEAPAAPDDLRAKLQEIQP